jgi:UrcA family protein
MNTISTRSQLKASTTLLMGLGAICLALNATSVRAADESPAYARASTSVQYSDLNLANPAGVKRLYERIVAASKSVCDSRDRSLKVIAHDRICTQLSIARAVKAVDHPELTAFAAAQNGHLPLAQVAKVTTP